MATGALNLLRLQLCCVAQHNIAIAGLQPGSPLLTTLRLRVVELAGGASVLPSVQRAAQQVLREAWPTLLPTPDERARALSALLPGEAAHHTATPAPGRVFMTDLLVQSLMAEHGLKSALLAAVLVEVKEQEEEREKEEGDKRDRDKPVGEPLMTDQAQVMNEVLCVSIF